MREWEIENVENEMDSLPKIPRFLKNSGGWIDFEIHFSEDLVHCARYRWENIFFTFSTSFKPTGKALCRLRTINSNKCKTAARKHKHRGTPSFSSKNCVHISPEAWAASRSTWKLAPSYRLTSSYQLHLPTICQLCQVNTIVILENKKDVKNQQFYVIRYSC